MSRLRQIVATAAIIGAASAAAGCDRGGARAGEYLMSNPPPNAATQTGAGHAEIVSDPATTAQICGPDGVYERTRSYIENLQAGVEAENGPNWSMDDDANWFHVMTMYAANKHFLDKLDARMADPDAPLSLKPAVHAYTRAAREVMRLYRDRGGKDQLIKANDDYWCASGDGVFSIKYRATPSSVGDSSTQ